MADTPAHPETVVEQVITELKSEFGRSIGPLKELNGLELSQAFTDVARNEVTGTIAVLSYNESPHGDSWKTRREFNVTLDDLRCLADTAPRFAPRFADVANELVSKLNDEKAADRDAIAGWCDQGLPTAQATAVLKPLCLKGR